MNTKSVNSLYKLCLTLGLCLISFIGFSQDHVTMTLKNVSATTNTVEFDMFIVNDGTTALKLAACSFGVNYSATILNGGTPANGAFTFIAGTRDAGLSGLNAYTVAHTLARNHLRTTMSPQAEGSAPTLAPNVEYRIGTFRFTNTVLWTTNGDPAFGLQLVLATGYTQCVATVYSNGNTVTNSLNTTGALPAGNISGTVISSIILNPAASCGVTGSGTTTPVTCPGGTNGTADITLAGTGSGAPGTYTVDGGSPVAFTTNPFTVGGLTTGNHTIIATVTSSGCVSSNIIINVGGPTSGNANSGVVSGNTTLCTGALTTFTSNGDAGGSWSSTNTTVATVNITSGIVTALSAGTTDITYTVNAGCGSPVFSFLTLTVNPNVTAGTVSGTSPLCIGATASYSSNGTAGGTWSSTNALVASVDGAGLVTALSSGTTDITYTVSAGCGSPVSSFSTLTVSPNVSAGTVSGTSPLCGGLTIVYTSDGTAGGTWSSSNPAVASVNPATGLVTSLTAGTTDITYTVNAGCGSPVSSFKTLTVTGSAGLAGVAGGPIVCSNATVQPTGTTFSDGTCKSIANIVPSGLVPVTGDINVCVTVDDQVYTYQTRPYVQRHYDIVPVTNAANATATITLYFTQGEFDAYNLARGLNPALPAEATDAANNKINLRVTQFHGTGTYPGNYTGPANPDLINPDDNNIVWNAGLSRWEVTFNVNGFSGFYIFTSLINTPLPVDLLSFNGRNNGNANLLEWSTSSEQNSSYFELERSIDGISYTKAGRVSASGNSSVTRQYSFIDDISSLDAKLFYYRLKQVDISGLAKYSTVVKIKLNSKGFAVEASPNPFADQMRVQIEATQKENAVIILTNLDGKRILVQNCSINKGSNVILLDKLDNLPGGVYLLHVNTGTEKRTLKVMKQK